MTTRIIFIATPIIAAMSVGFGPGEMNISKLLTCAVELAFQICWRRKQFEGPRHSRGPGPERSPYRTDTSCKRPWVTGPRLSRSRRRGIGSVGGREKERERKRKKDESEKQERKTEQSKMKGGISSSSMTAGVTADDRTCCR